MYQPAKPVQVVMLKGATRTRRVGANADRPAWPAARRHRAADAAATFC